jgi:N-acetylglucosamine transport system substrate-binding protein
MGITEQIPQTNRRILLRSAGILGLAAVPGTALLTGCATAGGSGASSAATGTTSAANPLGVDGTAPLEVVIFDGGYGEDFAKYDVSLYKKKFPKASATFSGIQDIKDQMQPRFVGGNPPDVLDNSGKDLIAIATLVADGQLSDLAALLNAPSVDDPTKTVADTLLSNALISVRYDGKTMSIPYAYVAYGIWYSASLFDKKGWTWPTTWSGLLELAGEMQSAGMAPFAYGGTTAPDYWLPPLYSLAAKEGGAQVLIDLDNLKPGAWLAEPMQNAANAIANLASKGYFMSGSAGLTHTQAQTSWVQGKAGLYASGSWIENEMKGISPSGFDMTLGAVPLLDSSAKLPVEALYGLSGEYYVVPTQAKNVRGGMEYIRQMLSKNAATQFSRNTHAPTIVKGGTGGESFGSSALASVNKAIEAAGTDVVASLWSQWYPAMKKTSQTQIANLLAGRSSASQFLNAMQDAANATAADSSIAKHTRSS